MNKKQKKVNGRSRTFICYVTIGESLATNECAI